ncbi:MAG: hypothetical protein AB1649_06330 [Chloroflexota bacterium]
MLTRIAVLTSHSLLADGLISRLREYSAQLELEVFDVTQPGVLAQVLAFRPLAIILEEYGANREHCSLKQILTIFPKITVIYMHLGESEMQVILSEQYVAHGVRELIEHIRPTTSTPATSLDEGPGSVAEVSTSLHSNLE